MQVPLYQAKAEFFRMLGHPVRIRVLELLQHGPVPVRDLLADIEIEPSSLSQQLAVLRRSGIVVSIREGSTVRYALAGGDVAELLRAARRILTELLAGQNELLAELRQTDGAAPAATAVSAMPAGSAGSGRMPVGSQLAHTVPPSEVRGRGRK
ncbi:ArsR/SmtB family transcription factor [Streptomyces sp. NPDC014889]|uniref:ArsR/SmtB family transcription factor n=1 Tax=Streptomyces sp. NPDC014889 TaxID=3364928 RepID=UPI0036F73E2B